MPLGGWEEAALRSSLGRPAPDPRARPACRRPTSRGCLPASGGCEVSGEVAAREVSAAMVLKVPVTDRTPEQHPVTARSRPGQDSASGHLSGGPSPQSSGHVTREPSRGPRPPNGLLRTGLRTHRVPHGQSTGKQPASTLPRGVRTGRGGGAEGGAAGPLWSRWPCTEPVETPAAEPRLGRGLGACSAAAGWTGGAGGLEAGAS